MVPTSYAGASRGRSDPEDILVTYEDEDGCPEERCGKIGEHLIIAWSGNEYSKRNTWIAADAGTVEDLQEIR